MPRPLRASDGGLIYHVLNRANAKATIFRTTADYDAFEQVLADGCARIPMRILAYCLMPNHWHLVLWPHDDGDLSRFMGWATMTHTQRWHAAHHTVGQGHLYQGRFKSFPVQSDRHFHVLCRYVEANAVRAGLVAWAGQWRWGSLWRRTKGDADAKALLWEWPVPCPENWEELVNDLRPSPEDGALRASLARSRPFGSARYVAQSAKRLGLASTLRARGRPRKGS